MGVVTASIGIVGGPVAPVQAAPVHSDDYPSWNDVQAAKDNVANQQALVDKINGLIGDLQTQVTAAGVAAEKAQESYYQARDALTAATQKAQDLQTKADDAEAKAKTSKMRAGLMASHLARSGGEDPSLDLMMQGDNSDQADKLLYQLGTMSKLTEQSQKIYKQAVTDKNEAQAVTKQAKVAEDERTKLATAANTALAAAKTAQANAQDALGQQQQQQTTLVAQLADLQNTSVQVQQQYVAGQQAAAAQAAALKAQQEVQAQAVAQAAQASGNGSGVSSGGGGGGNQSAPSNNVGAPNGGVVATAIAYAKAQLGQPYIFGGAAPGGWDCSGLTMMAYAAAGIDIGTHSVNNQWYTAAARGQIVSYSDAQPGDLLFWGDAPGDFYHVGIYLGGGMMIAAPTEGEDVKIQSVWGPPYFEVARPAA
jgi:cell wall-associated NlpC family hydrolase